MTEWTPKHFIDWASSIDKDVRLYIEKILERKQHPEQTYKSCLGILNFSKKVGSDRLVDDFINRNQRFCRKLTSVKGNKQFIDW